MNVESGAPQRVRISWEMLTPHDDSAESPPERDEGFWPSLDPESAGYIGRQPGESKAAQSRRWAEQRDAATKRYDDWAHDRWNYIGVVARAQIFIPIGGGSFRILTVDSAGLWGIESDAGDYLRTVYLEEKESLLAELRTLGEALATDPINADVEEAE